MSEAASAKKYWRSLSELENSPEFEAMLHREFPEAASEFPKGISRRRWLQLMGASLALGGMAGCRYREEKIAPLSQRPVDRIPGKPQEFATSIELAGGTRHLLVTSYDGRPLKVEGNTDHPFSLGGTDQYAQACILDMYDPDRGVAVQQRSGKQVITKTWSDFDKAAGELARKWKTSEGEGLAVLIEPTESLTLTAALAKLQAAYPKSKLYQYASISDANVAAGSVQAFDKTLRTQLALDKADVIVSLDADLLTEHPASMRLSRDYASRRDPDGSMNRLYAIESQYSLTGASADHRLAVPSTGIPAVLSELEQLVNKGLESGHVKVDTAASKRDQMLQAVADDLVSHPGNSVIAAGARQSAGVHARVHRLNALLENVGKTVLYTEVPESGAGGLSDLVSDIDAGQVKALLVVGGNPVFDSPADLDVAAALGKVETSIYLGLRENETSAFCGWYLPQSHPFETWSDASAYDGTISVCQPLIEPILGTRSAIEILTLLSGDKADPQQLVRQAIADATGGELDDDAWRRLLHDGFLAGSQAATVTPELADDASASEDSPTLADGELEVVFCQDSSVYDGRFANNSWLQETPRFISKLTWDNAAMISMATAARLGIETGEMIAIELGGKTLEIAAYVLPGQADGSIGIALGYGRTEAGKVGGSLSQNVELVGFDANAIRTSDAMFVAAGAKVTVTGRKYKLATTQDHHAIDKVGMEEIGRRVGELVREGDLAHYKEHPEFAEHVLHHPPLESLWTEFDYDGHAWGMSIDLNKCIGCNACSVACQAENNVPVVGKEQVSRGREMHWIRIDRYFQGSEEDPKVVHQPVACHHCENAPCEQVCPVAATMHSEEGLNDMVYNRCIGTRYCGNNCPYKVRRFNYFDNTQQFVGAGQDLVQLVVNPEVTVRSRGVMEKCTYCVQRIQNAKISAKNDREPLRDGDVVAACQQACPTQAIEFGDLNQSDSRVAKAHANLRAYSMLGELNVKPRTKYLARVRNPHPALASDGGHDSHDGAIQATRANIQKKQKRKLTVSQSHAGGAY